MTQETTTAPVAGGNAGMHSDYLEVRGLSVEFDGFKAVSNVDLTLFQGDLRFLIGPNGAGKTTMIDAITGLVPATGSVQKSGVELLGKKVHQIARLGVGRTFQTASVFEELSVLQNLDIAAGAGRSVWTMLRRRPAAVSESIEQALETIGLTKLRDKPAGTLAHGQKQWLEIGMLLVQDASVLLLDEPVAGMSQEEREETGNLLRRIGGERTVVVVEHDMDFMRNFATSVTVLARGSVLAEGSVAEVQADPAVQEAYLGTATAEPGPVESVPESVATRNHAGPSTGSDEHRVVEPDREEAESDDSARPVDTGVQRPAGPATEAAVRRNGVGPTRKLEGQGE